MLTTIIFDKLKYDQIKVKNNQDPYRLNNLSKLNIFIGANNSSKSRFLRGLFFDNEYELELDAIDCKKLRETIALSITKIEEKFESRHLRDVEDILKDLKELKNYKFKLSNLKNYPEKLKIILTKMASSTTLGSYSTLNGYKPENFEYSEIAKEIRFEGHYLDSELKGIMPHSKFLDINCIYIPILRGLRPIQVEKEGSFSNSVDNYKLRTLKDYVKEKRKDRNPEIFTGLTLYNEIKKNLLSGKEIRENVKEFEEFLSITFFNNKKVTLIPNEGDDVLHIGIGEEMERPIFNLGDGIQSIIAILYPLFMNKGKNLIVFIEEPENCMHPGMQRILIETLMDKRFHNFQYFISTHSNHFLDITLDLDKIAIYTFKKLLAEGDSIYYEIDNTNCTDIQILDLLGIRNSSVFLSNCTIWVEGITDRLYLKKYLEVYQVNKRDSEKDIEIYKEDFHYSFVEYGGANIVHWAFSDESSWDKIKASRISNKIFLIADSDSTEEKVESKKAARLSQLRENLKDNFRIIDGREIENTLSPKILINAIAKLEKISVNDLKYDKTSLLIDKYKNVKMGKFIQSTFDLKKAYTNQNGVIKDKVGLCKSAINEIDTIHDLSSEGKKLAQDIFNFIERNNKGQY